MFEIQTLNPINDLEELVSKIKRRKVKNKKFSWDEEVYSFHLSLLTQQEKKKLETGDEDFLSSFRPTYNNIKHCYDSPDIPKEEMDSSESNQKYLLSICSRSTFVISVDPWPEKVAADSKEDFDKDSSDESLSDQLQYGYDWVFS